MVIIPVVCFTILALAAIVCVPVTVRIVTRSSADSVSQMLSHLENSQTVGGTPVDIARQQANSQSDAVEMELEERRARTQNDQLIAAQRYRGPNNGGVQPRDMGFPEG